MYTAETFIETIKGSAFETDLLRPMNIQGANKSLGLYNLMILMRDVKLYKAGMRPNRQFKMATVKIYFNLKGTPAQVLEKMQGLFEFAKDKNFIEEAA